MQRVFVLDKNGEPLMPCQPARARELLTKGRAAVYRRYPFTIILQDREGGATQPMQAKIDPGSQTTGITLVLAGKRGKRVVWAAHLQHRGCQVSKALLKRRQQRRSRRSRKTRYRKPRFDNRAKPEGWFAPSVHSRLDNVTVWVNKLAGFVPLTSISYELVKFDTQKMQNPEIEGVEYQQGTLQGYTVREYLLEKFGRKCAYCGATHVPLQVEHLIPLSRGGSNRIDNLALACIPCNLAKDKQTAAEFGYPDLHERAKQGFSLRDVAISNAIRKVLYTQLEAMGLPVETGGGALTKLNRAQQDYPKAHWIDAACVGESGAAIYLNPGQTILHIRAVGRGSRQMCRVDRYGFPSSTAKGAKRVHGFQTGDLVRAVVPSGKKAGTHVGRVAVRSSGSFNITTSTRTIEGVSWKYCQLLHRMDGYAYSFGTALDSSPG